MKVRIPSMLRSYTGNRKYVEIGGETLFDVLVNLDLKFDGIKFRFIDEKGRIRTHMRIYVNDILTENMDVQLNETDKIFITQSLGGGRT